MSARELGIIFGGDSVRAILAGRKIVTRRLVKGPPAEEVPCRFRPGDRLWVRELWAPVERETDHVDGVRYFADDAFIPIENTKAAADAWSAAANNDHSGRARTPLYMPRWASRITLEVVGVRRENLLQIDEADAVDEGLRPTEIGTYQVPIEAWPGFAEFGTARQAYLFAWDGINGKRVAHRHDEDPRVDRIEFRRIACRA